jgi:hypothetical protein
LQDLIGLLLLVAFMTNDMLSVKHVEMTIVACSKAAGTGLDDVIANDIPAETDTYELQAD